MKRALAELKDQLGAAGIAALALLAAALAFHAFAVRPLEERAQRLDRELKASARGGPSSGWLRVSAATPEAKIEQFYRFFEREEPTVDWLAKLYGAAAASGLALRTGEYRLAEARGRLQRYQMTFPVAGSYTQVRAFLESALADVPVLSLDQVNFRRKAPGEPRVEAEIVFTLHLPRR